MPLMRDYLRAASYAYFDAAPRAEYGAAALRRASAAAPSCLLRYAAAALRRDAAAIFIFRYWRCY